MKNRLERIHHGLWGKDKSKKIISDPSANDDTLFIGATFPDDLRNSIEKTKRQL